MTKEIKSWCIVLLIISPFVWLYFDTEKARPILLNLYVSSFFALIACVCFYMLYQGFYSLSDSFKGLKEANKFKDKIWPLFSLMFGIFLSLFVALVAFGSLRMLYSSLKELFQ